MSDDKREIIEAAAEKHDVDLTRAVVAQDSDPASDKVFIIECMPEDGYRLLAFGLDADGQAASEEPIHIPETAVGPVQGLLHAAGLHVSNREFLDVPGEDEPRISIRDLAEGMGVSKPLESEEDEGDQ